MKKLLTTLLLLFSLASAFAQELVFNDRFQGVLSEVWKIETGNWYVADLTKKGITAAEGEENFALASGGAGMISTTIDISKLDITGPLKLKFNYWVHSKGSTGKVSVEFLNNKNVLIRTQKFTDLREKTNWEQFDQQFTVPNGTYKIRLRLKEWVEGKPVNTIYYQNLSVYIPAGDK